MIIAIPTKYIFDMSKRCLEAGKNVLMEKPMTESSDKAKQLVKLSESIGLKVNIIELTPISYLCIATKS